MLPRLVLCLPLILAACGPDLGHTSRAETQHGQALYQTHCAACHGTDGTGAGPASLGLGAPPPDLTMLSARNGGDFPRDYVMTTIDGTWRADAPDASMPEFGRDTAGALSVPPHSSLSEPVPRDMLAITAYLATLQTR